MESRDSTQYEREDHIKYLHADMAKKHFADSTVSLKLRKIYVVLKWSMLSAEFTINSCLFLPIQLSL